MSGRRRASSIGSSRVNRWARAAANRGFYHSSRFATGDRGCDLHPLSQRHAADDGAGPDFATLGLTVGRIGLCDYRFLDCLVRAQLREVALIDVVFGRKSVTISLIVVQTLEISRKFWGCH